MNVNNINEYPQMNSTFDIRHSTLFSFPFDGARRLGGNIVADAVDAADAVDDGIADISQEVVG